jgi:hypothetical protein
VPYLFNIREGEKTCKIKDGKKTVRPSPTPMTIVCKTTTQLDRLSWWCGLMLDVAKSEENDVAHLRMNFNFGGAVNSTIIESMALFFRGRFLRLIRSLDTADKKTGDSDNQAGQRRVGFKGFKCCLKRANNCTWQAHSDFPQSGPKKKEIAIATAISFA